MAAAIFMQKCGALGEVALPKKGGWLERDEDVSFMGCVWDRVI